MGDSVDGMFQDGLLEWPNPFADGEPDPGTGAYGYLGGALRCNRCGSTDVRWFRHDGKWRLFGPTPYVLHTCEPSPDEFQPIED